MKILPTYFFLTLLIGFLLLYTFNGDHHVVMKEKYSIL